MKYEGCLINIQFFCLGNLDVLSEKQAHANHGTVDVQHMSDADVHDFPHPVT